MLITALPFSVDVRTPDKLFDGHSGLNEDSHVWLSEFKNTKSQQAAFNKGDSRVANLVVVSFDRPTAISCIRLFNYSKTVERGVHEFEVLLDDNIVFRGYAHKYSQATPFTAVLFTSNKKVVSNN